MAQENHCPQCGAEMPLDAPEGLCPKCLMKAIRQDDVNATLGESHLIEGPGTKIGRYKLLELIGEGGMGLVYLAEQKEPVKRRVAFKIIKPGMDSRQVIARFEAERQVLALLDHPNIAHVLDAGTTETGRPYFVMEYVKGLSIIQYCDRNKLNIEQRLKLFRQVCEGVHHAHQKGIIHRDLKPSNILVSVHEDRVVPKIIDFGIAKATTQPLTDKTVFTYQGQLLGTPEYMSPEQVDLAIQDIDIRSDIYSLGVVLYELLAGVLPFERESLARLGFAEVQRTIREQEPASPSSRLSGLGEQAKAIAESRRTQVVPLARCLHRELEWIPLKAMRKDRCRRYRSAAELADDVQNYLDGRPLIAGPETAVYRVKKFVRRHAGSVATAALVAAAIVLGLVVSTAMYFRAESMRAQAEQARQKETIARSEAEQAREQAEQAEESTKAKAEELRRSLYVNNIQLADIKYREGNIRRVRELLDSCPNDLRGWEWHRLNYVSDQSLMTLRGHDGWVQCIAVSPDGKRVMSGYSQGTIRVWESATGQMRKVLTGHTGPIQSLAVSSDGNKIVSAGRDKTIRVWDAETGGEMMTLHGDADLSSVAISPDGRWIVSVCGDWKIIVWDAQTGEESKAIMGMGLFSSVSFSPDGKRIVAGGMGIKVLDSVSGVELMTLYGHRNWITSVSFSPDGNRIVSASRDGTIQIWDAERGVEMTTLRRGTESRTESVAFSPNGKSVVSGATPNVVSVWDVSGSGEVRTFRGHEGFVICAAFTPDGRQIVSGSSDGTIKVWDATIDREVTKLIGHHGIVFSTAFSRDGKFIASGGEDRTVKIWEVASGAEVTTLSGHPDRVNSVVFSPDGKRIVSGSDGKTIKIWDAATHAEVTTLRGDGWSVAVSLDGKRIVSAAATGGGRIIIWDAETGREVKTLPGHGHEPNWVMSVAFSPDGKRIVSGGADDTVRIWDSVSGDELMTLRGHTRWVASAAFSPDGELIVSGDDAGIVKVWDATTGIEMRTLRAHFDQIKSVAFSPDGKRILSGSIDGTVKVWDAGSGAELMSVPSGVGLYAVAFSPDGKSIAAGGAENIMLWESGAPAAGYEPRRGVTTAQRTKSQKEENAWSLFKDILQVFLPGQDKGADPAALEKAMQKAEDAVRMEPNDPGLLLALGMVQCRAGQYEDAVRTQIKAHSLDPNAPPAIPLVAEAHYRSGNYQDALKTLTEGLEASGRLLGEQDGLTLDILNALACIQAGCPAAEFRNGAEAVKNATRACELTGWKKAQYVDTLAAAYSEVGDFESAVKWQKEAISLLTKEHPAQWLAEFEERLKLYESGKPYRESPYQ